MTGRIDRLELETDAGTIVITLDLANAPVTCRYVIGMVEAGHFNGATFYRSTNFGIEGRLRLVQGGPLAPFFTGSGVEIPPVEMLDEIESTSATGLRHVRGTVSLARDLFSTGYVLSELFICLDDYPELDEGGRSEPDTFGFPAFGAVSVGLDIVDSISARDTDGPSPIGRLVGEVLTNPVSITRAVIDASPIESSKPT